MSTIRLDYSIKRSILQKTFLFCSKEDGLTGVSDVSIRGAVRCPTAHEQLDDYHIIVYVDMLCIFLCISSNNTRVTAATFRRDYVNDVYFFPWVAVGREEKSVGIVGADMQSNWSRFAH